MDAFEVLEDIGDEVENSQTVAEILDHFSLLALENLDDSEPSYRQGSLKRKLFVDQDEKLSKIVEEVWSELQWCQTARSISSRFPFLDATKQDALKSAMECGKVNQIFLTRFIRNKWESIRKQQKPKNQRADTKHQRELKSEDVVLDARTCPDYGSKDLQPHMVTFPIFSDLIDILLVKLLDSNYVVHPLRDYSKQLKIFGSRHHLKDRILKCIAPEVHVLEGKEVTRRRLDSILESQKPPSDWPLVGGYLLYITSIMTEDYWRPYVGQSFRRARRIPEHISEVSQSHIHTLCYWIAAKPGRQLNFISLWDIEKQDGDTQQSLELLNTLLEMIFSLAFESLPLPTLKTFLGTKDFSLRGLNVVSPLLQNIKLYAHERGQIRSTLILSPSHETRNFAKVRSEVLKRSRNPRRESSVLKLNYPTIEDALRTAIPSYMSYGFPNDDTSIKDPGLNDDTISGTICDEVTQYLQKEDVDRDSWAFPQGSWQALIRFVLDFDINALAPDAPDAPDGNKERDLRGNFPPLLSRLGFHGKNSLVWSFDFQATHVPQQFTIAGSEDTPLKMINRKIIDASKLQAIILCGQDAEKAVVTFSFEGITISFGKVSFKAFLQVEQSTVQRVYLRAPAPLSKICSNDWKDANLVATVIKIAACLTKTEHIHPYYFRSQIGLSEIVLARLRETQDGITMTEELITDTMWGWLSNKGFERSEISLLEKIGGSLSRGLLLAFITAPSRAEKSQPHALKIPRADQPSSNEHFTQTQLANMRKLHEEKQRVMEAKHGSPSQSFQEEPDDDNPIIHEEALQGQQNIHFLVDKLALDACQHQETECVESDHDDTRTGTTPQGSSQQPKKRKQDTAPPDKKGKDGITDRRGIVDKESEAVRLLVRQRTTQDTLKFQDQMGAKLKTDANTRKYFRNTFNIDTSIEGLMKLTVSRMGG
ncbi:hypothetical protein MYU51_010181 [Penicillium brevicompactum]